MLRTGRSAPRTTPLGSRPLIGAIALLTLGTVLLDQGTKMLAQNKLTEDAPTQWFLGELLGWKLLYNPGAALSLGTGVTWLLTLVALAVVIVIVRLSRRIGSTGWSVAFGLLLGGAVGNLLDRFFREPSFGQGHVVDFINYAGFFVGNVADIAIVLAAVLIGWLSFRGVAVAGHGEVRPGSGEAEIPVDSGDDPEGAK